MSIKYPNNNTWSTVPGTAGTFATPTQTHERYTATSAVTNIPITILVRPGDFLTVLRDNLPLVEGVDFTRGEEHVTLTDATKAGTIIDITVEHYDIAPTRGHVEDMADPHHTLAYITDGLQTGNLLKYDGTKLAKAAAGTDYDGPISTTTIDLISPWVGYNEANNKIKLMRIGNRVYLDGMIKGGAERKQIATLPEAYRIATDQRIMAAPCAGGMCRVDVYITGALQCVGPLGTGAPDQWTSLYGLSYTIY